MSWDHDDVARWLDDHPLPPFLWNGQKAHPRYHVRGYGKWLRESGPYYPALRGLFNIIAEIVIEYVDKQIPLPSPAGLVELLEIEARKQGELPIFAAGLPDPQDLTQPKPSDNPTETQTETTGQPNGLPDLSQP